MHGINVLREFFGIMTNILSYSLGSELRRLFQSIRELVERRFANDDDTSNLKWQSVSAFCFLRLIVPAILHPHLWGLHPGKATSPRHS